MKKTKKGFSSLIRGAQSGEPRGRGQSTKMNYWDKIKNSMFTPMPGRHAFTYKQTGNVIPRVQFGERMIDKETMDVVFKLNRVLQLRMKYLGKDVFKYPWEKTTSNITGQASMPDPYDGSINTQDQKNTKETIRLQDGCIVVLDESGKVVFQPRVSFTDYLNDYEDVNYVMRYAPAKSFCFSRFNFLDLKFDLYKQMFAGQEMVDMKAVSHRDFYNVRKIDNHIHLSASMNPKALLLFIRDKLKHYPDEVVDVDKKTGKKRTLKEVFADLKMTGYDISVDSLDVQAGQATMHRFDRFNSKFSPFGQSKLREIFLKVDNHLQGRYFAEITKQVFRQYELAKYSFGEVRISIYGKNKQELKTVAHWVHRYKLYSENARFLIQIPRLFGLFKKLGRVQVFSEMMDNVFGPFFEATINPEADPIVANFLQNYVVGFDTVDDESKGETDVTVDNTPPGDKWTEGQPPYAYYNYYCWAMLDVLNRFRKSKGMSTFQYRPHCGEAGNVNHLSSSFLVADSINHGIRLKDSPVLGYIYYLMQIGLSVSPLSNNSLFLAYRRNPFPLFFKRGLNVTLSTDDPLMFHFTREPLMEEYSICQQILNLSTCDICEIARNSVLQSGWSKEHKQFWISRYYNEYGTHSNNIRKTNVPEIRVQYRYETLLEEHLFIQSVLHQLDDSFKPKMEEEEEKEDGQKDWKDFFVRVQRKRLIEIIKKLKSKKLELFAHPDQMDVHVRKFDDPIQATQVLVTPAVSKSMLFDPNESGGSMSFRSMVKKMSGGKKKTNTKKKMSFGDMAKMVSVTAATPSDDEKKEVKKENEKEKPKGKNVEFHEKEDDCKEMVQVRKLKMQLRELKEEIHEKRMMKHQIKGKIHDLKKQYLQRTNYYETM